MNWADPYNSESFDDNDNNLNSFKRLFSPASTWNRGAVGYGVGANKIKPQDWQNFVGMSPGQMVASGIPNTQAMKQMNPNLPNTYDYNPYWNNNIPNPIGGQQANPINDMLDMNKNIQQGGVITPPQTSDFDKWTNPPNVPPPIRNTPGYGYQPPNTSPPDIQGRSLADVNALSDLILQRLLGMTTYNKEATLPAGGMSTFLGRGRY